MTISKFHPAGLLMAAAAFLTLIGDFLDRLEPAAFGALLIAGFVVLEWRRLPRAGHAFAFAAVALFGVAFLADDPGGLILRGLERAAFMCAFLTLLGILRAAAEKSEIVSRCGRHLLSQRPSLRYLAFWTGGTLFGAIISVGSLNLFGAMVRSANTLASAGGDARIQALRAKRSNMALLRGFTATLLWSPISISFAVVLTSLPDVYWQGVLLIGAGMALFQLSLGWLIDRVTHKPSGAPVAPPVSTENWSVHLFPASLIAAIFVVAWGLEAWAGISLVTGVMTGAPAVSLIWLLVQGVRRPSGPVRHAASRLSHYAQAMVPGYRMELTILGTAGFAGAVVGYFLDPATVAGALDWVGAPAFLVPAMVIGAVLIAGLLGLNAIISVMIIGGALPQPEVFGVHAVIQAASLLTAWGLTVGNSPVAMSTLIVGNLTDTPSMTVGLVWNRMYTVWAYLFASLVFGLAVAFTPV